VLYPTAFLDTSSRHHHGSSHPFVASVSARGIRTPDSRRHVTQPPAAQSFDIAFVRSLRHEAASRARRGPCTVQLPNDMVGYLWTRQRAKLLRTWCQFFSRLDRSNGLCTRLLPLKMSTELIDRSSGATISLLQHPESRGSSASPLSSSHIFNAIFAIIDNLGRAETNGYD
jgi:hypothetical protein